MSANGPGNAESECALSIVVVSWNTRELLLRCLESLETATSPASDSFPVEVWVVDNGSTDGTAEAVRTQFPRVRLVELERNVGYARGMNEGLARVRGRCVLMLNSDTRVSPGALERCVAVLESNPRVGAVGAQLVHPDGRLQNSIHAFPSLLTELLPTAVLEWLFPRRFPSKRRPPREPVEVEAVLGAALFVRAELLRELGPLSEDYFFFLEDTEWCWRLHRSGLRTVHVPDARIEHVSGASSKRKHAALTRIEFHRSLYRFLRVNRGRATLAAVVSLRITRNLVSVLLLLPLAVFSGAQRARLKERLQLLAWHLRGCPEQPGLAQLDPDAALSEPA